MYMDDKKELYNKYLISKKDYFWRSLLIYIGYTFILLMNFIIIGNSLVDGIFSANFIGNFG